jgi:uncharacterized protein YcfJ
MNTLRNPSPYSPVIAAAHPVGSAAGHKSGYSAGHPIAASVKPLWAAVGVLSICVLSMGASLVHVNKRVEPMAKTSLPLALSDAMNSQAAANDMIAPEKSTEKSVKNSLLAPAKLAQSATRNAAENASPTAPIAAASPAQAPNAPQIDQPVLPAKPTIPTIRQTPAPTFCNNCGMIEAVTPISKKAPGSGVGVIAGGVLGGVVGNQIGKGNGRSAATILGALGGGWAGNAIEKNMKKTTAYSVRIRMEDGSRRTIEQSTAPMVGSKVTLDGKAIRPA